jgi:hypothetical protein
MRSGIRGGAYAAALTSPFVVAVGVVACGAFTGTGGDDVSTSDAGNVVEGGGQGADGASSTNGDATAAGGEGGSNDASPPAPFCPVANATFCSSFDPPGDPLTGFTVQGSGGTAEPVMDVSKSMPASFRLSNGTEALVHTDARAAVGELTLDVDVMLTPVTSSVKIAQLLSLVSEGGIGAELTVEADGTVRMWDVCQITNCGNYDNYTTVAKFTWPMSQWVSVRFVVDLPPRAAMPMSRVATVTLAYAGATPATASLLLHLSDSFPDPNAFTGASISLTLGGGAYDGPSADAGAWTQWFDDVVLYSQSP